jgi:hypothetical protein
VVIVQGHPQTIVKVLELLASIRAKDRLPSQHELSQLRGLLQWLNTDVMGRPLSTAMSSVYAHASGSGNSDTLQNAFDVIATVVTSAPARSVPVFPTGDPPVIVYSDASTDAMGPDISGLRIGIWLMAPRSTPLVFVVDVPQWVVDSWNHRATYITIAELLAIPILTLSRPELIAHQCLWWFVDNQAALSALVRNSSTASDAAALAQTAALSMAMLRTRVYFEWVPTKANIADPLSRDGWSDTTVRQWLHEGRVRRGDMQVPWHQLLGDLEPANMMVHQLAES